MEKKQSSRDAAIITASHVNAWSVIARGLKAKGLHQKDLAALLRVTPPAITQFKQGSSKFSRIQLAQIADFLEFSPKTRRRFYAEIVDARLVWEPLYERAGARHESSR